MNIAWKKNVIRIKMKMGQSWGGMCGAKGGREGTAAWGSFCTKEKIRTRRGSYVVQADLCGRKQRKESRREAKKD